MTGHGIPDAMRRTMTTPQAASAMIADHLPVEQTNPRG
jgi:hypothetical protein